MNGLDVQYNRPPQNGIAYIAIPKDVVREDFIETCYRKGRVTLVTDYGAVINECYITIECLQQISFPEEIGGKGSCVVFVSNNFQNKPIVIGVIQTNDTTTFVKENMRRVIKQNKETIISEQFDPDKRRYNLSIVTTDEGKESEDESKAGKLTIGLRGNTKNEVEISSSGKAGFNADEEINNSSYNKVRQSVIDVTKKDDIYEIEQTKEYLKITRKNSSNTIELSIVDEGIIISEEDGKKKISINKGGDIEVESDKNLKLKVGSGMTFTTNNGQYSAVLGELLQQLITQLTSLLTQTFTAGGASGVGAPNFAAALSTYSAGLTAITTALQNIISKVVKLD